jgi:hypothetical protein
MYLRKAAQVERADLSVHNRGGAEVARRCATRPTSWSGERAGERKAVHDNFFTLADLKAPIDCLDRTEIDCQQGEIIPFIPRQQRWN